MKTLQKITKVRACPVFCSERPAIVSRAFEELLFSHIELLSEGVWKPEGEEAGRFFGSSMISCDLDALPPTRPRLDSDELRQRLLHAAEASVRIRLRASRIALSQARYRVPLRPLGTAWVETRVHLEGSVLRIDVDVVVPSSSLGAWEEHGDKRTRRYR